MTPTPRGMPSQREVKSGITSTTAGRLGGGCGMIFSLPFLGFGLLFMFGSMMGKVNGPGVFGGCFGFVFAAVGGTIFVGSLMAALGKGNGQREKLGKDAGKAGPDGLPKCFPAAGKTRRGPRGGVLLQPETSAVAGFVALLIFSLIWNGIVGGAIFAITRSHSVPKPALLCIGIFAIVGVVIIAMMVRALLKVFMSGTLQLEIPAEPLHPGTRNSMMLYLRGDFPITTTKITFQCIEKAVHGHGSDSTTHKETVFESVLLERTHMRASREGPIAELKLEIPHNATPSFVASSNSVSWVVLVEMELPGRPDYKDLFIVRVLPKSLGART